MQTHDSNQQPTPSSGLIAYEKSSKSLIDEQRDFIEGCIEATAYQHVHGSDGPKLLIAPLPKWLQDLASENIAEFTRLVQAIDAAEPIQFQAPPEMQLTEFRGGPVSNMIQTWVNGITTEPIESDPEEDAEIEAFYTPPPQTFKDAANRAQMLMARGEMPNWARLGFYPSHIGTAKDERDIEGMEVRFDFYEPETPDSSITSDTDESVISTQN